ncbi:IclR family transcriptional regulator [Alcanivorax xiamenensis]|uniref:HTH-type transcriptional repressor AllR n=1 Tax=Alcanivorax xiamenensis TaxID=1177156 RepID=A0ABQ6Y6Y9_9GAMM|nr:MULTISPECIES: IclR family transcriptional regulator C-terminal domain-containing protein [Alcanivorax]KAF0805169.1 IclR family transcriptional regulator [Alcanivorax xiamenensis]
MAASYQLQTLTRALDVLELLERTSEPLSLTEVVAAMGEATTIVYRILQTLEARGYVYRRPQDKRYSYTGRSGGAGSISRAVDLLQAAADNLPGDASTEQLSRQAGLDPRIALEILTPLADKGLIEQNLDNEQWRLSPSVMQLARHFLNNDDVLVRIRPLMERLHAETRETVSLFHRAGNKQIVTSVLPSPHPVRYALETGSAFPLYLGAAGKAILAFLPEAEMETLIRNPTMTALTAHQPKVSALRKELKGIRQQGFAISNGERVEGASAVAVPIHDGSGYPDTVLGLMMPSFRTSDEQLRQFGVRLQEELGALFPA